MNKTAREAIEDVIGSQDANLVITVLDDAGFVIMPKEPPEAMLRAGFAQRSYEDAFPREVRAIYRAMIAAAKDEAAK